MFRKLMLGAASSVLALGALAVPAAAVDTADVAIINGLPFKVDICVGSKEIVSRLKYGRADFAKVEAGEWKYKIRRAAPGKCKGKWVGVGKANYSPGGDYTSVIWKPFSKVKVKTFKNDIGVSGGHFKVTFRHTAKSPGAVDVWLWEHVRVTEVDLFPPSFNDVKKGQSSQSLQIDPGQYSMDVLAAKRSRLFAWEGYWSRGEANQVHEVYLVGTNKKNFKVVGIYGPGNP